MLLKASLVVGEEFPFRSAAGWEERRGTSGELRLSAEVQENCNHQSNSQRDEQKRGANTRHTDESQDDEAKGDKNSGKFRVQLHDSEWTGMSVNCMSLHELIITRFHCENQLTKW